MIRILTLDAATSTCSAGIVEDDTLIERVEGDLTALPSLVEALFGAHGRGIDLVAVTVGPGSFTGLRASIALAHGIGIAADVPVVGVTIGAALADGSTPIWTAIDSKRGRVFLERDGAIESVALDRLPLPTGPVALAGDAALLVGEALSGRGATISLHDPALPEPLGIARAASRATNRSRTVPAQPVYVDPPAARPGPPGRPAPDPAPNPAPKPA